MLANITVISRTLMTPSRMRSTREKTPAPPQLPQASGDEAVTLLLAIRDELRQTRELLQTRSSKALPVPQPPLVPSASSPDDPHV